MAMGIFPKISLVDKTFIIERALLLMVLEEEEIISLVDEVSEILTNLNVNCVVMQCYYRSDQSFQEP